METAMPNRVKYHPMSGLAADRIRCRQGLSQQDLANVLGYNHYVVNKWVNNKRGVHRLAAIILRLLDRGKITVDDIEDAR